MGMAASQARFLGLTARKTNVEYEGQQVNQQRTALSNESAGLFNQMLTLKVPVPPSATDYYNMRYSYQQNGQSYEILNITGGTENGKYNVTVRTAKDIYNYVPYLINDPSKNQIKQELYKEEKDGKTSYYMLFGTDTVKHTLTGPSENSAFMNSLSDEDKKKYGFTGNEKFYSYNRDNTLYYIEASVVENNASLDGYKNPMQAFREDMSKDVNEMVYEDVELLTDSNGRYSYITLPNGTQLALNINQVSDDAGYDQAMTEYNYEKMLYDKTIQDINAKTEKIQAQDRSLELRLKQLDTEQEALSKEMEAIKDYLNKNIENTFKTFG